jgi:hypothetical protein
MTSGLYCCYSGKNLHRWIPYEFPNVLVIVSIKPFLIFNGYINWAAEDPRPFKVSGVKMRVGYDYCFETTSGINLNLIRQTNLSLRVVRTEVDAGILGSGRTYKINSHFINVCDEIPENISV